MIDNLSIVIHAFSRCMLISFSVDEVSEMFYKFQRLANWSGNDLLFKTHEYIAVLKEELSSYIFLQSLLMVGLSML